MNVMDLSPIANEFDASFLIDSTGRAFPEGNELEGPFLNESGSSSSRSKIQHILDKDVSVDEDILPVPLQPTRAPAVTNVCFDDGDETDAEEETEEEENSSLTSILRRESSTSNAARKVSFPTDEDKLAIYREAETCDSWDISTYITPDKILQIYQNSCKLHKTIELDIIKNLIQDIRNNTNHSAVLNLSMINITNEVNETLEDLLKISNFRSLILYECRFSAETISEFFNMLEYYEPVCDIEIAMNFDESAWKAFCHTCTNIMVLQSISFKGMVINETYMRMLLNAIKSNARITTLKFDACMLIKLPSFYLVESLITNTTLCELYLPSTGLYTKEADCIGRFLQRNQFLKVLDISNNFIGDRGLEVLGRGLTKQTTPGCGLSVLVVFNNQITEKSGPIISNIISQCKNLHTLNIGYNNLTDEVILNIASSLEETESLEGLGLQSTLLTCKGIVFLAAAFEKNTSLQKINLKGNKAIQVTGLERLCQALTTSKIIKIEIDDVNRSASDPEAYVQLVKKINGICTVNKTYKESSSEEVASISQIMSRKVSLSCEPRYIIPGASSSSTESPSLSPSASPRPTKTRFQITKVQLDSSPRPGASRFKVTRVVPSPDDELNIGKFANVRSSVSSNDSVDSLQFDTDSD